VEVAEERDIRHHSDEIGHEAGDREGDGAALAGARDGDSIGAAQLRAAARVDRHGMDGIVVDQPKAAGQGIQAGSGSSGGIANRWLWRGSMSTNTS